MTGPDQQEKGLLGIPKHGGENQHMGTESRSCSLQALQCLVNTHSGFNLHFLGGSGDLRFTFPDNLVTWHLSPNQGAHAMLFVNTQFVL